MKETNTTLQDLTQGAQSLSDQIRDFAGIILQHAAAGNTYRPGDITPLCNAIIDIDKRLKLLKAAANELTMTNPLTL